MTLLVRICGTRVNLELELWISPWESTEHACELSHVRGESYATKTVTGAHVAPFILQMKEIEAQRGESMD